MSEIIIGSRGSKLALTQSEWVAEQIQQNNPGISVHIEIIRTKGDKILDTPLAKIGDKGLFVKEIELALAAGKVDIAVHSMKDLPSEMMDGLALGAVPKRVDPSDALLSNGGRLRELPRGAKIGSSSLRRKAQLMAVRPDLEFHDLRGNLDTRIRRLETGEFDGIILAFAGLFRLGWQGRIIENLPFDICLPAVGQGALAIEIRQQDIAIAELLETIDDPPSRAAVTAERVLMSELQGGCQTPIAANASPDGEKLTLRAMVSSLDGARIVRREETGPLDDPASLGNLVARQLLDAGARDILEEVREKAGPTDMGAA